MQPAASGESRLQFAEKSTERTEVPTEMRAASGGAKSDADPFTEAKDG